MTEDRPDYVNDAMEMLGKGYEDPGITIEAERTVLERRRGDFKEVVVPAFVKISTSFKGELKQITGESLKVFLFIALSVNRNTGTAHPGLRTIAEATGYGVNTVQEALKQLEEMGLLSVDRNSRKYNIYTPCDLVSANSKTVSQPDTDAQTVSGNPETVSGKAESVSASQILNQRNQRNQKRGDLLDGMIELSQSPGMKKMNRTNTILSTLGEKLHVNTETKRWQEFAKFVDDRQENYGESLIQFLGWMMAQEGFNIQFWSPQRMYEMWPQAFKEHHDTTIPKYTPPDESDAIPNPYSKRHFGGSKED